MSKKQYFIYLCVLHIIFFGIMWVVSKVPEVTEVVRRTEVGLVGTPKGFGAPLGLVLIALSGLIGALPYYLKHNNTIKEKLIVAGLVISNTAICLAYAIFICYG